MKKHRIFCTGAVILIAAFCAALPASAADAYIRGDANGDKTVDINDVTAIQRHLAELELLSGDLLKAADVNGGGPDISDATALQMYLAEYGNPCKIGEAVVPFEFEEYELPFVPID